MNALRFLTVGAILMVLCLPRGVAAAGDPLDQAKTLYANASYEAALKALDGAEGGDAADEYRILCLLALGRAGDAQHAVEALIAKDPALVPAAEDFPPRFITMYTATRQRVLPTLVMETFAAAREQYRASKRAEAATQFQKVLALSAEPALAKMPDIADARTLAAAFLDLIKASSASAPAARPEPAAPANTAAPATARSATPQPVASTITPAVPIREKVPQWAPPDRSSAPRTLQGVVRIAIGADGRVKSATIVDSVHPAFDALLLNATREWRYVPAVRDGKPVESERLIEVRVTP